MCHDFSCPLPCSVAKVMLVHAGGYSQRLPNLSVIGKVFMALPCSEWGGEGGGQYV